MASARMESARDRFAQLLEDVTHVKRIAPLLILACMALPDAHSAAPRGATDSTPLPAMVAAAARESLHEVLRVESTWVKVHAAEALLAAGEVDFVREAFEREDVAAGARAYRVGVWRVLANASRSPSERQKWAAAIEAVIHDPTAADRKQAVESVAKLAHRCPESTIRILRELAGEPPAMNTILPWWALHGSGAPDALAALSRALTSDDAVARQRAGYALRWIRPSDSTIRRQLARAADAEPRGTMPRAFLVSSALVLDAAPAHRGEWIAELFETLFSGPVPARLEAAHALAAHGAPFDAPRVQSLLNHPDNDVRVAGAVLLLGAIPFKSKL